MLGTQLVDQTYGLCPLADPRRTEQHHYHVNVLIDSVAYMYRWRPRIFTRPFFMKPS